MTSDAPFLHTDRDQAALAFGADPSDVDPSHHHPHPRPHPSLSRARPWWRYVKDNPPARRVLLGTAGSSGVGFTFIFTIQSLLLATRASLTRSTREPWEREHSPATLN
jgi:hypothetical protein